MLGMGRGEFPCHKTTREDEDGDLEEGPKSSHCAGALLFSEKNDAPTQMMRICERLGMYDRTKLRGADLVFDSLSEMLRTAISLRRSKRIVQKKASRNFKRNGR